MHLSEKSLIVNINPEPDAWKEWCKEIYFQPPSERMFDILFVCKFYIDLLKKFT